ncbi:type II toxin-antitoxin system VapC family toxin [Sphingomonas bacterium]|uniref:type II toxin-antitoxin system VapC family toxin n=1 Tax=Sphingomonas bacterium TaxID=1895847 RepID=UPI001C2D9634|nr:type II toxin-antitoxin system VapC family toxin [Sphingomonas bacterium]
MSAYLLDTHALVWWWLADPQLSSVASTAILDGSVVVSAVSIYEIANKVRLGKLSALAGILAVYRDALAGDSFSSLAVTMDHAHHAGVLMGCHRDPFDRLIAAQALTEDMTVITRDPEIAAFGCKVLW